MTPNNNIIPPRNDCKYQVENWDSGDRTFICMSEQEHQQYVAGQGNDHTGVIFGGLLAFVIIIVWLATKR